ncbi:MAG: hypothetical protein GY821_00750 [Gammaproteobacteria bacterium]|nr:hypothetical protein [Gammaproteobacteria bacterium]
MVGESSSVGDIGNLFKALTQNRTLEKLALGGVAVGCDLGSRRSGCIAKALINRKKPIHLDLRANRIDGKGALMRASILLTNNSLSEFDLRSNLIINIGMEVFSCFKKRLTSIRIAFNNDVLLFLITH